MSSHQHFLSCRKEFIDVIVDLVKSLQSRISKNASKHNARIMVQQIKLIDRTFQFSEQAWIIALIYLNKFYSTNGISGFKIQEQLIQLVVCLILSLKYLEDISFSLLSFESVIGIECHTLKQYELDLVSSIEFDLAITHSNYNRFERIIEDLIIGSSDLVKTDTSCAF